MSDAEVISVLLTGHGKTGKRCYQTAKRINQTLFSDHIHFKLSKKIWEIRMYGCSDEGGSKNAPFGLTYTSSDQCHRVCGRIIMYRA